MSRMLTLFVLVWWTGVRLVVLHRMVGCMTSRLTNRTSVKDIEHGSGMWPSRWYGWVNHAYYMFELSACGTGGGKHRTCSTGRLSESFIRKYLFNTAKIWLLRIWNLRMRSTIFFSGWNERHKIIIVMSNRSANLMFLSIRLLTGAFFLCNVTTSTCHLYDRHPGPDRQMDRRTDRHTHTRQNLYILAIWAVANATATNKKHSRCRDSVICEQLNMILRAEFNGLQTWFWAVSEAADGTYHSTSWMHLPAGVLEWQLAACTYCTACNMQLGKTYSVMCQFPLFTALCGDNMLILQLSVWQMSWLYHKCDMHTLLTRKQHKT